MFRSEERFGVLGEEECRGVRVKVSRVWAAPPDANYRS